MLVSLIGYCEVPITYCKYDGEKWGKWNTTAFTYLSEEYVYLLQGTYDEFVIHSKSMDSENYVLKVKIDSMSIDTDKSKMKQRRKADEWYVYKGTVEYISEKDEPFDLNAWPKGLTNKSGFEHESHKVRAVIKVAPYKRQPEFYNILFDNVGLAICVH